MPRAFRTAVLIGACLLACPAAAPAQLPKQPPPPARYRVVLRYDIPAPRDEHVKQYDAMIEHLERIGFAFDPPLAKRPDTDREDRGKNRMKGTIAPNQALGILESPSVAAMLLVPDDRKLDEVAPDQPVYVRLELPSGLAVDRQRELFEQVRALLTLQEFREAVGYDHRGYTGRPFSRLVGTVPAGRLDTLLKDLRGQPGGWLAPVIPRVDLPLPLHGVNPLRIIEVLRDSEPLKVIPEPEPRVPDYLEKISPNLWQLVSQGEPPAERQRVQVIFAGGLRDEDLAWRKGLADAVPGFFIEGHVGPYVTGLVPVAQIKALAALPGVLAIRLPRLARVDADPALKSAGADAKVLAQSGVALLHQRGAKGAKVKLGIIDTDFRGWEALHKAGKLPPRTRLVDLTAERNADLAPAAYPGQPEQPGHGTLCARAAALAAPEAELVLIRTDAIAPYQLREIVRYTQGAEYAPLVEVRRDELVLARAKLRVQREALAKERARVLNNFEDETELRNSHGFLGPMFGWLYSERDWHHARMDHHRTLEAALVRREQKFERFVAAIDSLRGIQVLSCPLVWSDGFPLGGLSPLSRWFEEDPARRPLWFQSAGDKRGQCWLGDFRNLAGQPAMDFAAPGTPLPKGRWTTSLNFLAWQPHGAARVPELPEKTELRLTIQWREPHDPDYFAQPGEEDLYRKPLAALRLVLLRQRDPEAKALPADLFEVVARSAGRPQRLEHQPSGTIYEIALNVTLDKPGRYALRVEKQPDSEWIVGRDPTTKQPGLARLQGLNPIGIRPLGVPVLPELVRDWELKPRIFVETTDEVVRPTGRVVLDDFWTDGGTVGMPADSRGVISVGAADLDGKARPDTTVGALPFAELSKRPTLLAYDAVQLEGGTARGSSIATAFAAGTAAALLSAHVPPDRLRTWLHAQDGKVLHVPATGR